MSNKATPILKSRRFYKDKWHPYGWEVGYKMTCILPNGKKIRTFFNDVGINKSAAIANSLRRLDLGNILGGFEVKI